MFKKKHSIKCVNKGFLPANNELIYQSENTIFKYGLRKEELISSRKTLNNYQLFQEFKDGFIGLSRGIYSLFDTELNEISNKTLRFREYELVKSNFLFLLTNKNYETFEKKMLFTI